MTNMFGGVERPGPWETTGDHERRIRALEALENCCEEDCTEWSQEFETIVATNPTSLLGHWTLSETADPFLDTNPTYDPNDGTVTAVSVALTRGVEGCLPGQAGLQFNASDGASSDYVDTTSSNNARFNLNDGALDSDMTIIAWLKPFASASTFSGNVIGQMTSTVDGWRLYVSWPSREVNFNRANSSDVTLTGPALPADECTLVVATYSNVDGHSLYYGPGELVDSDPSVFGGLPNHNIGPLIGRGGISSAGLLKSFYGVMSEISVWNRVLTTTEISSLFSASQCISGLSACEAIDSTENVGEQCGVHSSDGTFLEQEGYVLTADGLGGSLWAPPDTGECETIDSTENVGDACGVHSENGTTPEAEGYVLTADGSGGSAWQPFAAEKIFEIKVIDDTTDLETGDGQMVFCIPAEMSGFDLTAAAAFVSTESTSGLPTIQIRNVTQAADMLSTEITIDEDEFTSYTATDPPVIDTGNDDVATGDLIAIDVDVAGTGAKGLGVILTFNLP